MLFLDHAFVSKYLAWVMYDDAFTEAVQKEQVYICSVPIAKYHLFSGHMKNQPICP